MPPRKRLGQLLTELGVIDEHQLQSALGHQKQWGGKIGTVLVQKGFCKEAQMVSALSQHLGMPLVQLASAKVDPRAVKFVSKQVAEKLHVFPYEVSGSGRAEVVTIAMSDPTDLSAVDQLAFHTGKRIKPILAGDSEIVAAIQAHYGGGEEKKAAPIPAAAPAPAPAPAPAAAQPAAAAAPAPAQSPWRAAPPAASPASPAPAQPTAAPEASAEEVADSDLEEIEPEDSLPPEPAKPAAPAEPLELPADDGGDLGLEPIAAHSQFGDAVSGQEDISGEGSPVDAVEGLEPAGVRHEGADEAAAAPAGETVAEVDLDPIDADEEPAPEADWDAKPAPAADWSAPAPAADWSAPAAPASDWNAAPAAPAAPTGWDEAPPAADWAAPSTPPPEAIPTDRTGEELPVDAILGTADSAEAPDAWASSDDPLAGHTAQFSSLPEPPPEGVPDHPSSTTDKFALAADETADETAEETAEEPAAANAQEPAAEAAAAPDLDDLPPEPQLEDLPELEGWVAPQAGSEPETEPAGEGWFGGQLDTTAPLSAAELGTLASAGIDANDTAGALRLLAALLRVLGRRQLLDLDEVAAEVRESRAQAAQEHAETNGMSASGQNAAASEPGAAAGPLET